MSPVLAFRVAALLGFFAVILGASGAHGRLHDVLAERGALPSWQTAVLYHLVHSAVLLVVATRTPFCAWAYRLIALGVVLFSGSLYLLALAPARWLGPVTPLGGLCLLAGWLTLAVRAR